MVETTGDPSTAPAPEAAAEAGGPLERPVPTDLSVRALLDVGAHFGHQTRRWDPRMKPFIYGDRHGIHILNLDATRDAFEDALDFVRERVAQGGRVLFVGTKRQAEAPVKLQAERCGQYYVNHRWLGGMLTNFRTVKKSIERFKQQLELLADEEKVAELSKKDLSRVNRSVTKYRKSLDGIREMTRLPDLMFLIDVNREHIALSEARRLGIPIVAIVDTNCNPEGIDYVVPGNDDSIRALEFYCRMVADACAEGAELHNQRVQSEVKEQAAEGEVAVPGRRVVEIQPQQTRGGADRGQRGGGRTGKTRSHGGPEDAARTAGTHQSPRRAKKLEPAEASPDAAAPAAADAATPEAAAKEAPEAVEAPETPAAPES